ncbi:MAG: peptidoglycan D,D-transpeptidase FtsI family protein [Candidatus Dormibacteria bacterium]
MSERARPGVRARPVVRGGEWDGRDWRSALLTNDRPTLDRHHGQGGAPGVPAQPAPGGHRSSLGGPAAPGPPPARGWFVGEGPHVRGRAIWLMLSFAALAGLLLGHLFQVQVSEHATLSAAAAQEENMSFVLAAQRGDILDSEGQVLVSNVATWDVHVDPTMIRATDRDADAAKIAAVLKVSESQVVQALEEPNEYAFLASNVSQSVKDQLVQLKIDGIILEEEQQPVYDSSAVPGESFAANLLGFVNASGQGQYGVEGYYNQLLTGKDGTASEIKDSNGNAIYLNRAQMVPAQNGDDLELGLNSQIQYWAEQAIANAVNHDSAQSGQLLVMDTRTGAIEAWADYPSYDANDYASTPIADFADPAVDAEFEPGSVMKVVTFAGALQNGAITPGYTFNEGPTTIDGVRIQDWDHRAHGEVSMQTVLDMSLNNGAIKAQQLEGANDFYDNMLAFGIGAPTGVDLAGEAHQEMAQQTQLSALDYAEMSFGQSVAVTPVEMLAAVNAVANGGVWVEPHAVDSIVDPNTGKTTQVVPATRRVVSAATAATLTTMMTHVVDDPGAEGFDARIAGWSGEVAGKTGTAQEPINGQLTGSDVSFVGFLPASDPQFTMMVVLDEPQVPAADDFGSMLAAPVWRQMAEQMIDYERLTP